MLALALLEIQSARTSAFSLPYDSTCPVIYDNDDADDMYTDEYLLSLASAGDITLQGVITTSGGWSQTTFPDPVFNFQWDLSGRSEIVGKALRSGLGNLPTPVAGSGVALVRPDSGVLEDTTPIDTPGAHLIVTAAHNATTNQPLVVVMGGPPTTLASAYLMDNSITGTVVLAWLSGGPGENDVQNYNDTADQWATTVVDQRFRIVLFGPVFQEAALVDKSLLTNLPNTELRQWMIDKSLPHVNLPGGQDHDGPPAITLLRPDYILTAKPKSVGSINSNGTLVLQDDPNGNILMVTAADQGIATAEWWRALSNSAAYGNNPLPPTRTPYTGSAAVIPGRVEAEQFDYGGPGVSYSNLTLKTEDEYLTRYPTTFRVTDNVDFDGVTNTSGYALAVTQAGEWLDYTVTVATSGLYALDVRLACLGPGGTFHIEFAGLDQTGPLTVPDTGGWQTWQILTKSNVTLAAGPQLMRLVMDSGGFSNLVGDIDYMDFSFAGTASSNAPPPIAGFTANPTNGPAPLLVNFTDSSGGTITSRLWDFGDGNISAATNPSHTYGNPGAYTVTLTVFGPDGTNTISQPGLITVTLPPPPVAGFTANPTNGAAPLLVSFTDASIGAITNRLWDFGDGTTDIMANPSHTYGGPGTYGVTLSVFGPGGTNVLLQPGLIVVSPPILPPPPLAGFTASPTQGVAPLTVNFTDTSTGAITNQIWDFGDGATAGSTNVAHAYNTPGVYSVSLSVFGPGGSNTATQANIITVTTATNTPPQIISVSVASSFLEIIGGTFIVKSGNTVAFATGTFDADGNPLSCLWDFGDGGTSTDCNPSHAFTTCGPHDVSVTVSDGFTSVTTGLTVAATCPMEINSLKLQAKFMQVGSDTCSIKGTLPASANGFSPTNAVVTLNVGGVPVIFQLNAKGSGSSRFGTVKFAYNKKTATWTFTGKLRGNMHDIWAQIGLTEDIVIDSEVGVPVQLTLQSNIVGVFDAEPVLSYTDKAGISGTATYVPVK